MPRATIWPPLRPARGAEVEQLIGALRPPRGRARPPAACCPGRGASSARPAAGGCRAGAGRSSARRARRARRTGRCRPGPARRIRCASPPESVGAGRAKRQVLQAHVDQELQPVADLADQLAGDLPLGVGRASSSGTPPAAGPAAGGRARRSSRPRKPHGRRVVAQPAAAADGALDLVDQVLQLRAEARARRGWLLPAPDRGPCIGSGTSGEPRLRRRGSASSATADAARARRTTARPCRA